MRACNACSRASVIAGESTFARIWTHNGFLNFGSGKISKSDTSMKVLFKRAFKLRTVLERHGGEALRYFCFTSHYRSPLAYDVIVDGDDPATAPLRLPAATGSPVNPIAIL